MSDPTNDPTQPPEKHVIGDCPACRSDLTPEQIAEGVTELLCEPKAEPKDEPKQ